MKKILMITNHSYMLWRFRRELIQELAKEHEVVLSMPFVGHEDDFQAMGLRCIQTEVDRRGINPAVDLKLYRFYKKILRDEQPDMVITYSIKPNIYAGYACGKMGIPYCVNVQGLGTAFQREPIAAVVTMMYRIAMKKAKTVFFENTANAEEFVKRGIVPASRQTILHGAGVNLEQYKIQPYPNHDKVHFLFLGRIMKEKGMDELLEAVNMLRKDNSNFVLDLVGFFEDTYEQQVNQLNKAGVVKFHGFQENPNPFYAAADCVVLPSYHEGMSNVLLEAAAMGRPLITSDIPGCREAVENGKSGFLVPAKDTQALYLAMKQMLDMNAAERRAMGLAGRAKMQREFSKETIVEQTIEALNSDG